MFSVFVDSSLTSVLRQSLSMILALGLQTGWPRGSGILMCLPPKLLVYRYMPPQTALYMSTRDGAAPRNLPVSHLPFSSSTFFLVIFKPTQDIHTYLNTCLQ